ncbi:MFS transporter [Lentzea sp. NBRC 105346]|uniref:MFS transporter n=1 Tax=Lentzea sp. NBRC 105346 TaxID=3032205 RepID=UPI0024A37A0F|nr:MFS transporter [Lentzea sp. NBRC 105346]GLZ35413.1 MFS transporter [Lentzea sp. NBRC 105346]
MTLTAQQPARLWAPEKRWPTTGLVLLVTLLAFEAMGVGTAMPRMVMELHGESLYAWPFITFMASSLVGTVFSGRLSDLRGPRPAVLIGVGLFLAGLVVAGTADSMTLLLIGRVLQGLGAGTQVVAIYVLIAAVYPDSDHPAAFGALAAAWVVPGLVGPTLAGWLTEHLTWRLVFLGLVPLVLLGFLLLLPVLRRLPLHTASPPARRFLPLAAVSAAAGVAGLSWAMQHRVWWLGLLSLVMLGAAVRVLLPAGTLQARRGLPVTVLARGLLGGTFFAVEAFVPLTLTVVHGYSPFAAGIPLTMGAVGWSLSAMWQGRHTEIPRQTLVRWGFVLVSIGLAAVTLIAPAWGPAWATALIWGVTGMGMGIGMSSVSVLVLGASTEADRGFNSAAVQISDQMGAALFAGVGGVLVVATAPTVGVIVLSLLMAGIALMGAILTGPRCRDTLVT